MRRFVLGWKKLGLEERLGSRIVTYADDLVILCRRGNADAALRHLRELMGRLKLTVNEEKTRICRVPESHFDFLGYTFGRLYQADERQALHRHAAVQEEHPARCRRDARADGSPHDVARHHRGGGEVEPHVTGLGELLQCGDLQVRLSCARWLHRCAVAPVVTHQTQDALSQGRDLSTLAPIRVLWARASDCLGE